MEPASQRIQAKLQFGLLPSADPVKTWPGQGSCAYCDGCDAEIPPGQAEVELVFAHGGTLRLHETCAEVWLALKGELVKVAAADLERRDQPAAPPHPVEPYPLPSSS